MLDNKPNQSSKFRKKNWVVINDDSCGTCNTNSHAYILFKGTISVANRADAEIIFKIGAPFTDCISEIKQYTNG